MLFHLGHEPIGRRAIDDPVVEGEAEVTHGADGDGIVDDDGALLHRTHTENASLRLIDDGCAEEAEWKT